MIKQAVFYLIISSLVIFDIKNPEVLNNYINTEVYEIILFYLSSVMAALSAFILFVGLSKQCLSILIRKLKSENETK